MKTYFLFMLIYLELHQQEAKGKQNPGRIYILTYLPTHMMIWTYLQIKQIKHVKKKKPKID